MPSLKVQADVSGKSEPRPILLRAVLRTTMIVFEAIIWIRTSIAQT